MRKQNNNGCLGVSICPSLSKVTQSFSSKIFISEPVGSNSCSAILTCQLFAPLCSKYVALLQGIRFQLSSFVGQQYNASQAYIGLVHSSTGRSRLCGSLLPLSLYLFGYYMYLFHHFSLSSRLLIGCILSLAPVSQSHASTVFLRSSAIKRT